MRPTLLARFLISLTLFCFPLCLPAANFTWSGDYPLTDFWSQGENWVGGVAPAGTDHHLFFDGEQGLINDNDSLSAISSITFNAGAGDFTLQGNTLTLAGNIINLSQGTQTFDLSLLLSSHRTIDTGHGTIVLNGSVGTTDNNFELNKKGAGTLHLNAHNTYGGLTKILRGTLVLNAATGSFPADANIWLGNAANYLEGNNGRLEIVGANYTHNGSLVANTHGSYVVKLDGHTVSFNNYTRTAGTSTVNFDLTVENSELRFDTASAGKSILTGATVTTMVGGNPKTSFAAWDSETKVVGSLIPARTLQASGNSLNVHYQASGNVVLAQTFWFDTLTITGGGHLTESGSQSLEGTRANGILMQEGSGDYRVSITRLWGYAAAHALTIHQHSTDGALIIDAQLLWTDGTGSFTKTGPGKVHLTALSSSSYTGVTFVQRGELQVDGVLSKTAGVRIYEGGLLSGGGVLGSVETPTAVLIREGATLQSSMSEALDIHGDLTFNPESEYSVILDFDGNDSLLVSGSALIQDGANLSLQLTAAPTSGNFALLQAGTLTGTFATINGQVVGDHLPFTLSYNQNDYIFTLFHDHDNGTLYLASPIPEPATLAWLTGLSLIGWICWQRKGVKR